MIPSYLINILVAEVMSAVSFNSWRTGIRGLLRNRTHGDRKVKVALKVTFSHIRRLGAFMTFIGLLLNISIITYSLYSTYDHSWHNLSESVYQGFHIGDFIVTGILPG